MTICERDGAVFLNPRWSKARYADYYAHEYDRDYRARASRGRPDARASEIARVTVGRIAAHADLPRLQNVLDIGAGTGHCLRQIRRRSSASVRLAAIEPSPACSALLEQTLGVHVLSDDVESDWDSGAIGQFDLVIMRHVLEHFRDVPSVLAKVSRVLSDGGLVYVAVPDMLRPKGPLRDYWYRVVHTYYFSRPILEHLASRAGLRPVATFESGHELALLLRRDRDAPIGAAPGRELYARQMAVIEAQQAADRRAIGRRLWWFAKRHVRRVWR